MASDVGIALMVTTNSVTDQEADRMTLDEKQGPAEQREYVTRVAAGLRRASHEAGVDIPLDYAVSIAAAGLGHCDQLGVSRAGDRGVVLSTKPDSPRQLPVLLGFAEPGAQWYRNGERHWGAERSVDQPAPTIGL